jgi:hypothetical protein
MRTAACLLLLAGLAQAGGPGAVERKIAKEPEYRGAERYYALLVLGPEAERRVWFAVDGEDLYADLNGNGDLTEPGEKLHASSTGSQESFIPLWREWRIPGLAGSDRWSDIKVKFNVLNPSWRPSPTAGNRAYMDRFMDGVAKTPGANISNIEVTIGGTRTQFCNAMFATSAEKAPVFHMDAPLTVGVLETIVPHVLGRTPDLERVQVAVGTPGSGGDQPGCFSYLMYQCLPEAARPVLEIEFPLADGKRSPATRFPLDEKC